MSAISQITTRRIVTIAALTGLSASLCAAVPAHAAAAPRHGELLSQARTYFAGENAIKVDGAPGTKATRDARALDVSAGFAKLRDTRMAALEQRHRINTLAGVRYSSVDTTVTATGKMQASGNTATLPVKEHTEYSVVGSAEAPNRYTVNHTLTFTRGDGNDWALSAVKTADGAADFATPRKLNDAQMHRAEEKARALRAQLDDRSHKPVTDPAKKQGAAKKARRVAADYDYTAMVDFARRYAETEDVPYERDDNDCTNFISQALAAGGWAEEPGWYQSDSSWWYNDNGWPFPDNHSYTWGGAPNFQRFARDESQRVYEVDGADELYIADVVQLDIPEYGGEGEPGHTMMVTNFTDSWVPQVSYHSEDHLDRPISEVIAEYPDEEFWFYRT